MRVLGLVIMTEKKYDDIRRAQTMKIVELMQKNGSLEWDIKKLQEMLNRQSCKSVLLHSNRHTDHGIDLEHRNKPSA